MVGICSLVVARGHYSIDVLLAYFVTSRLWWIYHTMANNNNLKVSSEENILSRAWWFYIFWYFEQNVPSNLPRRFSLPVPPMMRRFMMCVRRCQVCKGRRHEEEIVEVEGAVKNDAGGIA